MKIKLLITICCVFLLVGCKNLFTKDTNTSESTNENDDLIIIESNYNFSWMGDDEEFFELYNGFNGSYYAYNHDKESRNIKFIGKDGTLKWEKEVGYIKNEIIITSRGSIITYRDLTDGYYVLHIDENGNEIWKKGPFINAAPNYLGEQNNRFNFLFEGKAEDKIVVFDNDGEELFSIDSDSFRAIEKTSDNGYLLLKRNQPYYYLEKYDEDFNSEWKSENYNVIIPLSTDYEDNIILIIETLNNERKIIKYDNNGNVLASLDLQYVGYDFDTSLDNKLIYLIPYFHTEHNLLCLDENLNLLWEKEISNVYRHRFIDNGIVLENYESVIKYSHDGDLIVEIPMNEDTSLSSVTNSDFIFRSIEKGKEIYYKINDNLEEVFKFGPNGYDILFTEFTNSYIFIVLDVINYEEYSFSINKVTTDGNLIWSKQTKDIIYNAYELKNNHTGIIYTDSNTDEDNYFIKIYDNEGNIVYDEKVLAFSYTDKPIIFIGEKDNIKELEVIYNE